MREILRSQQWLARHNIPCKLTPCLDHYHIDDELKHNPELIKNYSLVLKNIWCVEAPGVVFTDRNTSTKLPFSPRQLIAQLKSTKINCTEETMLISIEHKWNR